MQASALFDIYQRQLQAMQALTAASLSGLERSQQAAISTVREVLSQQCDVAGRVTDQATSIALDPERVRPALDGIMQAQRDMMNAVAETQRRCMQALTPEPVSAQDGSAWFDSMRQSIDQWQRWSEQVLGVAREQTERIVDEAGRQARQFGDASTQAMRSTAGAMQDTTRRAEEATQAAARRSESQKPGHKGSESHA